MFSSDSNRRIQPPVQVYLLQVARAKALHKVQANPLLKVLWPLKRPKQRHPKFLRQVNSVDLDNNKSGNMNMLGSDLFVY